MKKRIIAGILSAMCIVSLVGCGSGEVSNEYIKIGEYKGVEVTQIESYEITDEDVEYYIESILQSNATAVEVTDRAVEEGDFANIDYVGTLDGVAFDGGTAEGYELEIGSGSFIEGFEEGLIGVEIGASVDLNLTFPEGYGNEELDGQDVVFAVTVNSVSVEEVPELTDEFVQTVSEDSTTVEEYKVEIKSMLVEENEAADQETLASEAWAVIMDNVEIIEYPEERVAEIEDNYYSQYEEMATMYSMEFADFLEQYMGMTEDDFASEVNLVAQDTAIEEEAVAIIAKKEKLELSDAQYEEEFVVMAEEYGFADVDALKEAASVEDLKIMILTDIVKEFVGSHAVQVEEAIEEETVEEEAVEEEIVDENPAHGEEGHVHSDDE